jgi:hypothetical protein
MDIESSQKSIPLAEESEIPPPRTDDPEYFWLALIVLMILSIIITVILFIHGDPDPGYT